MSRKQTGNYTGKVFGDDHVMTVAEYLEDVAGGCLIDDDGDGHPVKDGLADSGIVINPSDGDANIPLDATHIVWFNV